MSWCRDPLKPLLVLVAELRSELVELYSTTTLGVPFVCTRISGYTIFINPKSNTSLCHLSGCPLAPVAVSMVVSVCSIHLV